MGRVTGLKERRVSDENFAHCVGLMGACAAWAEGIREGQRLTHNDLNIVQIPVEIALAFIRRAAEADDALGEAARSALDMYAKFATLRESEREP